MCVSDGKAQTRSITWRTAAAVKEGVLEWSNKLTDVEFYKKAQQLPARSSALVTYTGDTVYYHTVQLTGLLPGKNYSYRVGNDPFFSEWIDFTMPADSGTFQFIYLGDAQNDVRALWSRVFRKAFLAAPQADFILHAGDLINHSQNEHEWSEWFYGGNFMLASKPQLLVPGNHEYVKGDDGIKQGITPSWNLQFNYPNNGVEGMENRNYYVDHKNCRFIFMDSNESLAQQAAWLAQRLQHNTQKWTIVMFHHPVLSGTEGRINEGVMTHWKPLLDQYHVDLVLQGHDHVYARGSIADAHGRDTGTTYVISMAGRKAYEVGAHSWLKKKAGKTQSYQIVDVSDSCISFKAFDMDGKQIDAFRIRKQRGQAKLEEY